LDIKEEAQASSLPSPYLPGQENHTLDEFRVPAWSSRSNAVAPCVHEYKNPANVKSGERSQEITFDFISAEAGILRRAQTVPGHQYQIEAWGKHIRSESPVELSLGVDLTGGEDWQAASVAWHPWDEAEEEVWVHTQVAVRGSGPSVTVFLKGYHPFAARGGERRCSMTCASWIWGPETYLCSS
jgi:hypothetical protein